MSTDAPLNAPARQRVLVLGATGTIGQAAVKSLLRDGHEVVCFIRAKAGVNGKLSLQDWEAKLPGAIFRTGDVTDLNSLTQDGFAGEHFDTLMSCLASRTGNPKDAWAIDHAAHILALKVAQASGVKHFVLLSAICVQKPLLTFQHAKLAFEDALVKSGMGYAIVRPTAFFKSLCGQLLGAMRDRPCAAQPNFAHWRARPRHHSPAARGILVFIVRQAAQVQTCTRQNDGRHHWRFVFVGPPHTAVGQQS
jgi:divinyl chlorophyllide a 8-vinyl-reductase